MAGLEENEGCNEVVLHGRLSGAAVARELPSGDELVTARLVVPRTGSAVRKGASVDVIDIVAWSPRIRRTVRAWSDGDVVEVSGALRKRFFRQGERTASRVEVEVSGARRVRRATTG